MLRRCRGRGLLCTVQRGRRVAALSCALASALLAGCLLLAHFESSKDEGTFFGAVEVAADGSSLNGSAVTNIPVAVEQMIQGDRPIITDATNGTNVTTRVKHGLVRKNGTVTLSMDSIHTLEVQVTVEAEYYGRDDLPSDAEVTPEPTFTAIEEGAHMSSGTPFSCSGDTCQLQEPALLRRQSSGLNRRLIWNLVPKWVCGQVCEDAEVEGTAQPVCTEVCSRILVWVWTAVSSCFPEDAELLTPAGVVRMSQVEVGSLVRTPWGYEPVYFQAHATTASTLYIILITYTGLQLAMSPDHYIMADREYRLAKHVKEGMSVQVRAAGNETEITDTVIKAERRVLAGAYNPLTASGELYVNGVRASVWSSWFLEGSQLVPERMIPTIYQVVSLPIRWIYAIAPEVTKEFCARVRDGPAVSAVPLKQLAQNFFLAATRSAGGGI